MQKVTLEWHLGFSRDRNRAPERRIAATIPGAVQLDWAKAEGYEPYTFGDNYRQFEWMEKVFWFYSAILDLPELQDDERIFFVSKGIDYAFEIRLGGSVIHYQEGMFTPVVLELTGKVSSGDLLEIVVYPAPVREDAPVGRSQADQCCKPAVSYGWDFHPRLLPLGIWDETCLEIRNALHIRDAEVFYELSEDFSRARVSMTLEVGEECGARAMWRIYDRNEYLISETECGTGEANCVFFNVVLEWPELWWPNGQGEPVLYRSVVELYDLAGRLCDRRESRLGFRKVRLVMQEGEWERKLDFPKGPNNPPITLEINGKTIFCKGSNWISPHIFPGVVNEEIYRKHLTLVRDANMNLLRSWGGAVVNKEVFYSLCDEYGIMVWQEFPLCCNNYAGMPGYLKILDQESRSIIGRLRRHPCHAIWCGGNELFNSWSGMTEQSLPLRLLNRNCYDLDPEKPFLMTSPVMGMGHGNYTFRYETGQDVFERMPQVRCTAYTEFGVPGPASVASLKRILPESELFPPKPGTMWEVHHGFGSWTGTSWLYPDILEHYFGKSVSLEELIERGQLLQAEGYKCIFEEARRQKPYCSMALNWCLNEPWPAAANNSIISWPDEPKPAYEAVKNSLRPLLASARIPRFVWTEGELFSAELWVLNDLPVSTVGGTIKVSLRAEDFEIKLLQWDYTSLAPNRNLVGPTVRCILPRTAGQRMVLCLEVDGRPELGSEYTLLFGKKHIHETSVLRRLND